MGDQFLVVKLVVDVKPVPYIAAYHNPPKAKVLGHADIVDVDTSESIHLFVYQPQVGSPLKTCVVQFIGMGIINRGKRVLQEYVFGFPAGLTNVVNVETCA